MSALGQKRTFCSVQWMPALPPKADVVRLGRDVRSVPDSDIGDPSFDHLVGAQKK